MRSIVIFASLLLSACGASTGRDYDSSAACAARGVKAGDPTYAACMREESQSRALETQRQEFDERREQDEFWRNHKNY